MKKTLRVITEVEIEVDIPDHMLTPEYREEFERSLYELDGPDGMFKQAAVLLKDDEEREYEGFGVCHRSQTPSQTHVTFNVYYDELEVEVIE